ncbi:Pectinesterase inhibitor [Linum perenne]
MATLTPSVSSLFLLLIIILTTPTPSSAADITAICGKAADKSFCHSFLNRTRAGKPSEDLVAAGKIVLDAGHGAASGTRQYVKSLVVQTTDAKIQGRYKTCLELYSDVSKSISKAKASFVAGDYVAAGIHVTAAQTYSDTCNEEVVGLYSDVPQMHRVLFNILDIGLVIANMLIKRVV